MSKKNKSARRKAQPRRSGTVSHPVRRAVLTAGVYSLIAAGSLYGIKYFFLHNSFFEIKGVNSTGSRKYSTAILEMEVRELYAGRNIFTVDLRQVENMIKKRFPFFKNVTARRVLPENLEIDFTERTPAAFLNAGSNVVIDKEAIVLADGVDTTGLVEIKGLSFILRRPSVGENVKNAALIKALLLLEALKKYPAVMSHNVKYVDISDKNNVILDIDGALIRFGDADFSKKMSKLEVILNDPEIKMKDIRYIDLRFDGAVITPK